MAAEPPVVYPNVLNSSIVQLSLFYDEAPFVLLFTIHYILQICFQDPGILPTCALRQWDLEVFPPEMYF